MALLHINHLFCGYGSNDVIHDISLEVAEGEMLCLLGPNGCGKSTLLKAIAGLLPYRGELLYRGRQVAALGRKELARGIALMAQRNESYFDYSIYQAVLLGRYVHGSGWFGGSTAQDEQVVRRCLEDMGLWELREQSITSLSGGQLQRVFLARTLAQEPALILLDEPTNHLDLKYQLELLSHLQRWRQEPGRAVISVLHDLNLGLQHGSRAVLLQEGRLAAQGTAEQIRKDPALPAVFGVDIRGFMVESLKKWQ